MYIKSMSKKLTERQLQVLRYVSDFHRENGFAPTVREIATHFGFSVKGAYDHIIALEKKTVIFRASKYSRTMCLSDKGKQILNIETNEGIPIYGSIAAGLPILAEENMQGMVDLPHVKGNIGDLFALQVRGDSMIGAGVHDKDVVICRKQSTADNGEIVAVQVRNEDTSDEEATLKYFYFSEGTITLRSANSKYADIKIKESAKIIGKLVGLVRTY